MEICSLEYAYKIKLESLLLHKAPELISEGWQKILSSMINQYFYLPILWIDDYYFSPRNYLSTSLMK
jgi:hypothetical protein